MGSEGKKITTILILAYLVNNKNFVLDLLEESGGLSQQFPLCSQAPM
jgi:hypothetical protein